MRRRVEIALFTVRMPEVEDGGLADGLVVLLAVLGDAKEVADRLCVLAI